MAEQAKNNSSDEIDLGQLFQLIGKGFQKLFDFIGAIFKGVFNLIIVFLLFLQKNFVLLAITVVIGGIVGFLVDLYKTPKYVSKMVVEPNFNSVQQLYNNIDFYNDLANAKDSLSLSRALDISVSEAATISKVFVDSYSDENQKIQLFDEFIRELDTTTVKALDYESYLKNFNSMDARFHQISLISTDDRVAKKVQPSIIKSIAANEYFKLQKRINDENIALQEKIYNQQLTEIDSLQQLYKRVLVKEADKPMQGTNINLAENGQAQNKELALVKERDILKSRLVSLNRERANKSSILNVISDFPARGAELKGFWARYIFVVPIVLSGITIAFLLLTALNKYLKRIDKKDLS